MDRDNKSMKLAIPPCLKHTLEILGRGGIEVDLDPRLNQPADQSLPIDGVNTGDKWKTPTTSATSPSIPVILNARNEDENRTDTEPET